MVAERGKVIWVEMPVGRPADILDNYKYRPPGTMIRISHCHFQKVSHASSLWGFWLS